MGLEIINNPGEMPDAGLFNLPPGFPTEKYAASWVDQTNVEFAKQRQSLPQTGYSADGWEIYRESDDGESVTVKTGGEKGKTYVLMVRPAALQRQINALYGNVSKKMISRETKGLTVGGAALQDPGMLTADRLQQVQGGGIAEEEGDVQLNPIEERAEVLST